MSEKFMRIGAKLFHEVADDDCFGLAAEMAFHLILTTAPMFIFFLALFGLLGNQQNMIEQLMYYASTVMPEDGLNIMRELIATIVRGSSGELAILSLVGALWSASNGAGIIIKALRRAYDVDETDSANKLSFVQEKAAALLIVLSLGGALFIASNLLIFGNVFFDAIVRWLGQGTAILVNIARWLLVLALVVTFSAYIYRTVPGVPGKHKTSWKSALSGAVLFVLGWLALSFLFSFYVDHFGNYNQVYGAIGALIVTMLWLYFSSLAFLAGGELNAILEEDHGKTVSHHRPLSAHSGS